MIDSARKLLQLHRGYPLPADAHWLVSPSAWMTLRKETRPFEIEFTGVTTQKLLGIELRIGLEGMEPPIDLILGPDL